MLVEVLSSSTCGLLNFQTLLQLLALSFSNDSKRWACRRSKLMDFDAWPLPFQQCNFFQKGNLRIREVLAGSLIIKCSHKKGDMALSLRVVYIVFNLEHSLLFRVVC